MITPPNFIKKLRLSYLVPLFLAWGLIDNIRTLINYAQVSGTPDQATHGVVVAISAQIIAFIFWATSEANDRLRQSIGKDSQRALELMSKITDQAQKDHVTMRQMETKIRQYEQLLNIRNQEKKDERPVNLRDYLTSALTRK